jgi:hypothetical protein
MIRATLTVSFSLCRIAEETTPLLSVGLSV